MGNIVKDGMTFRTLSDSEVASFGQWARDNDTPDHRGKANLYHPAVIAEWARIDAIMDHPTTVAVKHYRLGHDHAGMPNKFPAFAWPGGYTILYLTADGGELCAACVNGENGSEVGSETGDEAGSRSGRRSNRVAA